MNSSFRLYLLGLLTLFGAYVALEYYRPKPLDWRPTLSNKDKIPYGTYALYDVLPQLLGTDSVTSVRLPIYNQLLGADEPTFYADSAHATADSVARQAAEALPLVKTSASYVFLSQEFECSGLESAALLHFIEQGNNVFIGADDFVGASPLLTDTLGVKVFAADSTTLPGVHLPDSVRVHFASPALPTAALRLPAWAAANRLALKAGHRGTPLASDAQGRPVLLRLDRGRGHVYLCTVPLAFSNYFLLPPRQRQFALAALSYLPTGRPVWWDEYQKQGRAGEQSMLRVLFSSPGLRTAYYLLWVTVVLFIFIEARRRQRIIPVIKPLPNTTLLFTRTVASLYQQGRNHQRIAEKKTALFLDYLRTRFHEPTPDLGDEDFRERLSQKSGVPRARVEELMRHINFARTAPTVTDTELLKLSRAIRDFKREAT